MKLEHKIMVNRKDEFKKDLDEIGFPCHYEQSAIGSWITFEISQSDSRWETISAIMRQHNIKSFSVETKFNNAELLESDYLIMWVDWVNGYPQPESGYEKITYDNGCQECRMGIVQKSPFRLKGEPRWGR
jgi:hypothetical protein